MNLKLLFTKNQFMKNYLNVGSTCTLLHRSNTHNLIGIHNNLSIINLNVQLYKIRKKIFLIINFCYKNSYSNPLIVNTINNKFCIEYYKKLCKRRKINYFLGTWWNGLLRNFNSFINHRSKRNKQFFFYKKKFPNYCLFFSQQTAGIIDTYSKDFYLETSKVSLLSIHMLNTTNSSFKLTSGVFLNTRSIIGNLFVNKVFFTIANKSKITIKKKFLFYVLNKWKSIKIKNYLRCYIYEFFFIKYFLFRKKIVWESI